MGAKVLLSDKEWEAIQKILPDKKKPWRLKERKGGRKPLANRRCFEGILWILWTGAPWESLPKKYGSKSAVHKRLRGWVESGVWKTFAGMPKKFKRKPKRLIADRAYDSNVLRKELKEQKIEPIIPARKTSRLQRIKTGEK